MQAVVETVISSEGKFLRDRALKLINGPGAAVFKFFLEYKEAELKLRQLSMPLATPFVENLIRDSLGIPHEKAIGKREILISLILAMMEPLRQTVGSCFATAPLILVQAEQPLAMLDDLYELMTRGSLRRIVDGVEVRVPMNMHISKTHHPLLKCWEYTVAGFADVHVKFAEWNLYTGLGFNPEEKGGIGQLIYTKVELLLAEKQLKIREFADSANRAAEEIRMSQAFSRSASTYEQMDRFKREIRVKEMHMVAMEDYYHMGVKEAEELSRFYAFLIEQYQALFPGYFQELYDPDMIEVRGTIYEDSPAGFRLVYKHGRYDPSVWEMIYDEAGYIRLLSDFFKMVEPVIELACESDQSKVHLREITDAILHQLHEPIFITTAKERSLRPKSGSVAGGLPWAYVAGGSMESLARCYFKRRSPFTKQTFKPENPFELCVALIEFMKDHPQSAAFEKNPQKAILMESPTHAFLFKPGLLPFAAAWQDKGNTYTYLRDHFTPHSPLLLFADTNWGGEFFAFHKTPDGAIDLWITGPSGARPFPEWNHLFAKQPWYLYTNPHEYLL